MKIGACIVYFRLYLCGFHLLYTFFSLIVSCIVYFRLHFLVSTNSRAALHVCPASIFYCHQLPFSIAINLTYHNYSELNIINLLNYNLCNFELVQYCYLFSFRIYWCFSPYYNLKIFFFFFFLGSVFSFIFI